ncbi:MAG: hypothetical protein EPN91_08120 [Salinibacterium sp.]|nr:MAG: hypothetical protein EPN91_08120 [Salinibacterium sp.]
MVTNLEQQDPRILTCTCGRITTFRCSELWPHEGLVPCSAPYCGMPNCGHRHEPGTMGYPRYERGSAEYLGDAPDGPGVWQWVLSRWRALTWSPQRKAQHVWNGMKKRFPPPAPVPPLVLRVGNVYFTPFGDTMKEMK